MAKLATVRDAAYLRRIPARSMAPDRCCYCNHLLSDLPYVQQYRRTKDHILAKTHGRVPVGITNLRPSCARCNMLRATLGHCVGALMLTIIEAAHRHLDYNMTAIDLGMLPKAAKRIENRRRSREIAKRMRASRIQRQTLGVEIASSGALGDVAHG